MTVQVETSRVQYVADGVQVEYAFNFRVFQYESMVVYLDGVKQISGYTLAHDNTEAGGTVTFDTAPANGVIITLNRELPFQQLLDLIEYDKFPAESVESALDWIVYLIQQVQTGSADYMPIPPGLGEAVDLTFPPPGAGEYVKYNEAGDALETADIRKLDFDTIDTATDQEIIDGTQTTERLISPAQVKLGVESHETAEITDVQSVAWVEIVDVMPGTPDPTKVYFVRE